MTKRESFLLKILGIVIILSAAFLSFSYRKEQIQRISSQKEQYIIAINKLSSKDKNPKTAINEVFEYSSSETASKSFFSELKKIDITPEKYQILSNKNIEITLNVDPDKLISFLFSEKDEYVPYQIELINIKKVNERVQAIIQIKPIFSKSNSITSSYNKISKVTKLFEEDNVKKEKPIKTIQEKKPEIFIDALSVFDYIGKAKDENGNNLLVLKNKETGRLIKLNIDKITSESFIFSVNDRKYELKTKDIL